MNTYFQRCTRFVIFALILTLLIPVMSVETESSQTKPVKLKVLLLPFLSFGPYFIAEEEGFFAEQGLEVEYIKMDGASEAIPALLHGELDVVAGTISIGVLNAIARGGTIKIVADKGHVVPSTGCPTNAILVSKTLFDIGKLDDPAQLQGRKIAVDPIGTDGYYVEKVLKTIGLTFDDVTTKDLPFPALPKALGTSIDIAQVSEPWLTRILKLGNAALWIPAKDVVPNFQLAVIMYGTNLLDKNPDAGRRFLTAYLKAVRQYNQGKIARNVDILSKYTGLEPELLQEACWPAIYDDGRIHIQSVLDFQTWALEKKLLDALVSEDQFWDNNFIEYANQMLRAPSK